MRWSQARIFARKTLMIYLNGKPLNITMFPDNTSQVWQLDETLLKETNFFHITWEYDQEGEFMQIAQLKHLLDSYEHRASLRIAYLPYGRQDKFVANNTTFALRTFAQLLNLLAFEEVIIHDPHSTVALDLINHARARYPVNEIEKVMLEVGTTLVCYPDKGALTKYSVVYKSLVEDEFIYGEKVRDQATGNILSYTLKGNPKNHKVLIVDDICDGGMTFKLLTKDLLAAGATEVNLFVTHGIFSKGLRTLTESGIKRIFTQNGEASELKMLNRQIAYRRL